MKKIIIANWKMNPATMKEAQRMVGELKRGVARMKNKPEIVVCPPFVYLDLCAKLQAASFKLGSQDCFWQEKGAFTGEISCSMLKNLEVKYVLVGHSEREMIMQESQEIVNKKLKTILKNNLTPVLCLGETKEQREKDETFSALEKEFLADIAGVAKKDLAKIVIAYEPIWAVGSGKACSPDDTLTAILYLRKIIASLAGKKTANMVKMLYGGSVNAQNASEYLKNDAINGLLVGERSLDIKEFLKILNQ